MICGPDCRRRTDTKQRIIKAISQNIVFSAAAGTKKNKKHLQLGLAIKSLTASRQIIELLNRI